MAMAGTSGGYNGTQSQSKWGANTPSTIEDQSSDTGGAQLATAGAKMLGKSMAKNQGTEMDSSYHNVSPSGGPVNFGDS